MSHNIFEKEKVPVSGEIFNILLKHKNVVIEKIISSNLVPEKEYIQDHDEWVLLMEGEASMLVDGKKINLIPGDYYYIASRVSHTVLHTRQGTVWLAIHIY